ncbi:MAG: hypothetical protein IPM07_26745, partial [Anaerolineales bacterium]|nr:hypothetical protein [Anaerolineales bacterium]
VMGDFNAVSRWDWSEDRLAALRDKPTRQGGNLAGDKQGPQVIDAMEKAGYVDLYRRFGGVGRSDLPVD